MIAMAGDKHDEDPAESRCEDVPEDEKNEDSSRSLNTASSENDAFVESISKLFYFINI
mgnify:CR=1 FL=1